MFGGQATGRQTADEYARQTCSEAGAYNGFNLLLCDGETLVWVGHRHGDEAQWRVLDGGIHALSNHLPGTPWPKLLRARDGFARALAQEDAEASTPPNHPNAICLSIPFTVWPQGPQSHR